MFKLQNEENGKRVLDNEASTYVASPTGIDFNLAPSDTNGKGIYIKSGTENDKYPIYYYRGEVDNNNIIFAGFCWKIVRTTETGGTKLVYNGVPTNGTCNNTGTETQIRKSSYANVRNSLADSGYMRGERYISETKSMKINKDILKRDSVSADSNYYYGNSVIYENGNYILENAELKEWSTNYETLSGYYTCKSTATSCSTIYYVVGTDASYMYSLNYSGGISKEDANTNITLGKNIINNNDGTYTLQETTAISKTEWYNNYNEYNGYYVCSDLTSTVCDSKNYISTTSVYNLSYDIGYDYIYGNDVIYENGVYTLVDTYIAETGWSKNSSKIGLKYHYTCFSTKDTCETVYYISSTISSPSYVTLTNGKTIDTFLDEMTSKSSNQYASTMKTTIDNWYKENMTEYTKYIEDAIWCNDRGIYNKGTWDKEPTTIKEDLEFDAYNRNVMTATPSLECKNVGDRFTVDEIKSGRANGNGALTYPVALLTADELTLAGNGYKGYSSNSYLTTGEYYLTMTPYHFSIGATACIFGVDASGFLNVTNVRDNNGVRPSISLKLGTKISDDGDGTANNPFVVIEE